MEFLIEDVQVDLCGAHHPVGHDVGLKSYPTVLITAGLPFQRKMIVVFSIDDGSHQRGRGDAVAEEIRGTSGLNNAAVIVPGGILVDMVLIMSVQPGLGGQKYIPSSTDKIRRLKAMLDARGSKADIQVDGGVSAANLREVLDAGANIIVAGSAVFGGDIEGKTRALMSVLDEYNQR